MNDRELHCRGKASEERAKARVAPTEESAREHLIAAAQWEIEADKAAAQSDGVSAPSEGPSNHAA
jgi:hypothetical protein